MSIVTNHSLLISFSFFSANDLSYNGQNNNIQKLRNRSKKRWQNTGGSLSCIILFFGLY